MKQACAIVLLLNLVTFAQPDVLPKYRIYCQGLVRASASHRGGQIRGICNNVALLRAKHEQQVASAEDESGQGLVSASERIELLKATCYAADTYHDLSGWHQLSTNKEVSELVQVSAAAASRLACIATALEGPQRQQPGVASDGQGLTLELMRCLTPDTAAFFETLYALTVPFHAHTEDHAQRGHSMGQCIAQLSTPEAEQLVPAELRNRLVAAAAAQQRAQERGAQISHERDSLLAQMQSELAAVKTALFCSEQVLREHRLGHLVGRQQEGGCYYSPNMEGEDGQLGPDGADSCCVILHHLDDIVIY